MTLEPIVIPKQWSEFQRVFAEIAGELIEGRDAARRHRKEVQEKLAELQSELDAELPPVEVPPHVPKSVVTGIRNTIKGLRQHQRWLLDALRETAEDFENAVENEDRFVVVVFGEVNAGKSALANHVAGLDFDAWASIQRGVCFVGERTVDRLEEAPIECTREYQGFQLPGLLWIDCPGVLSSSFANAQLGRRLVARADFLVFVSSSDAPFKRSELEELAGIIEESGQDKVDACVVVTKADTQDDDEDPDTGRVIRRVVAKERRDWIAQAEWCREQLVTSGLGRHLRIREPLAVSVYVARDALGRGWENGAYCRRPDENWEARYETSGMPALLKLLSDLVAEEGPKLKAAWPKKRAAALRRRFDETARKSRDELKKLSDELESLRSEWSEAQRVAARDAAELASGEVAACLTRNGVYEVGGFHRDRAQKELGAALRTSVQKAVTEASRDILEKIESRIDAALAEYVKETSFSLDVKEQFKTHTYQSATRARGVGRVAGELGGATLGSQIGGAIFPGLGMLVGGFLGGFLGGWVGEAVGGAIGTETVSVRVSAGTNAGEVIAETQKEIKALARTKVKELFKELDASVFGRLLAEIEQLQVQVGRWGQAAEALTPGRSAGSWR
jgi:hypothetical protein